MWVVPGAQVKTIIDAYADLGTIDYFIGSRRGTYDGAGMDVLFDLVVVGHRPLSAALETSYMVHRCVVRGPLDNLRAEFMHGNYDIETLEEAISIAKERAK